tara:strand:+ start:126 stop:1478 length:1353 start_codon:yes stop_codon:yes gene_type:complete
MAVKKSKKSKKSKKIKKRKTSPVIEMYGQAYEKPHYVNWLPEIELLLRDMVKNTDYANLPTKLLKTNKGKYWNSECIYPRTKNEFIHRFFEKKEPRGIEGIWDWEGWGIVGVVREKSCYQMYDINVTLKNPWKAPVPQKGFVDNFMEGWNYDQPKPVVEVIDYHLCNGTKGGAFLPTSNKNKFKLIAKGVFIVPSEDGQYTFAHEEQNQTATIINNSLIKTRANFGDDEKTFNRIWPEFTTEEEINDPSAKKGGSSGTAFFIDNNGHIITNYHVIASNPKKQKAIYKNKEFSAKVIAKDKQLDLALLKINVSNKYFIKILNKPIKKLQSVIAAGYPGGKILSDDLKFTSGIISSLKGLDDNSAQIQIDAALNSGNSGGPIVDSKTGELTAVAVSALRKDMTEGINFGIKVSQVRDFLYANNIDTEKVSKKYKRNDLNTILENSTLYIFSN